METTYTSVTPAYQQRPAYAAPVYAAPPPQTKIVETIRSAALTGRKNYRKKARTGTATSVKSRAKRSPSSKTSRHRVSMVPKDGPDPALHRALVLAPVHAKQMLGKNYQKARLSSGFSAMPTRLIEQRSVVDVTIPAAGSVNVFVLPSLQFMCLSEADNGGAVNAFQKWDNSGLTDHRPAQGIDTQFAGVGSGRCLAMGAEIVSTENITSAKGQIGMVSCPGDPTGQNGVGGKGVSQLSMQDLSNFEGAIVGRAVEGVHCYWQPEENCMSVVTTAVATSPAVNSNGFCQWSYDQYIPIGWTVTGARASTVQTGVSATDYADYRALSLGQGVGSVRNQLFMLPCIMIRVEGATVGAIYKLSVVQHWEVYDYKIGADRGRGATGVAPQAHRGLVGTLTNDVEAAFHEVEHVAGEGAHLVGRAIGIGEEVVKGAATIGKYAALAASLF